MGRKSLNKNRKPITKKVKQWLEKLLLELQDKDLEKVTIDDLALLADKSKSTIYIYFDPRNEYVNMCGNTHVHYKNVRVPACVLYTHLHAFMKCCSTAPS